MSDNDSEKIAIESLEEDGGYVNPHVESGVLAAEYLDHLETGHAPSSCTIEYFPPQSPPQSNNVSEPTQDSAQSVDWPQFERKISKVKFEASDSEDSLHGRRQQSNNMSTGLQNQKPVKRMRRVATEPKSSLRFSMEHQTEASSEKVPFRRISLPGYTATHPDVKIFERYDVKPRPIFVETDQLYYDDYVDFWQQTSRWIKYEERVEQDAKRWGKPKAPNLLFRSLLSLRKYLEGGLLLFGLEVDSKKTLAYKVVEELISVGKLVPEERSSLLRTLLLKHKHIEPDRLRLIRKNSSLANLLQHDKKRQESVVAAKFADNIKGIMSATITVGEQNQITKKAEKSDIMKKIPGESELALILHGSVEYLDKPITVFIRLAKATVMLGVTEVPLPVRFIFILLGPVRLETDFVDVGRAMATLLSNTAPVFQRIAYKACTLSDLYTGINDFLEDTLVIPLLEWDSRMLLPMEDIHLHTNEMRRRKSVVSLTNETIMKPVFDDNQEAAAAPIDAAEALNRTGKPFGGMIRDIKCRWSKYLSDILDGLNPTCLATMIFIYFACLTGGVAFGGLYGDKTNKLIGVSETLVGTAIAGVGFALLAAQPLIILGANGPMLLFDQSLFSFCDGSDIDFLGMRFWIGLWLVIISVVLVGFEGSMIVKLCTRFTQDIFTALICFMFIFEGLNKLAHVYHDHPLKESYCDVGNFTSVNETISRVRRDAEVTPEGSIKDQPNTALLATILMLGTFFIAYFLKNFRNSKFLGRNARRTLGDFGVPIAIVIMVAVDLLIHDTYTEKLSVPEGLTPSNPDVRGWVVNPLGPKMKIWMIFAAIIPALLAFILLFLELSICQLVLSSGERGLRKGSGFHLDIVVLCSFNAICGIIGSPWIAAATIRTVSHLSALTIMSTTHAPGTKPHVAEVKEQRLTGTVVSILVGVSVSMAPVLRLIPMAVLFGVFLYMGVSSMKGVQMLDRVTLLFKPVKHHPDTTFVTKVRTWKMNLYTCIQVVCLVILWIVKSSAIALAFPFFLLLLIPLRFQLKWFFTEKELLSLDGGSENAKDADEEPDFYEQASSVNLMETKMQ